MDVLSDVLLAVRLTGAVFFDVDAGAPFATETPSIATIGERVLAGPQHVISFHVVTEGTCWAEVVDRSDRPVALSAGDMVVFPRGDANIIASAPGMRGKPDPNQYHRPDDRALPFYVTMTGKPERIAPVSSVASWAATLGRSTHSSMHYRGSCTRRCRRGAGNGSPVSSTQQCGRAAPIPPGARPCWPSSRS